MAVNSFDLGSADILPKVNLGKERGKAPSDL